MSAINDVFNEWLEGMTSRIGAALEAGEINSKEHGLLNSALRSIRVSVTTGDSALAVIVTNAFWGTMRDLQKPALEKALRSKSASHAAQQRHQLPMPTVKALKDEYRETQKKLGEDARPTTIYKAMAKKIPALGDKKYWRRIRTQLEK